MISQILFGLVLVAAAVLIGKRAKTIQSAIQLGKPFTPKGAKSERFKNMVLFALGQKKMFKRIVPAVLHLFVYVGFIIINIEVLEIVIDGVSGQHRVFLNFLPASLYTTFINVFEVLAALVILGCILFLVRRNLVVVKRFAKPEMKGWPSLDGNLILLFEIILMSAFLKMNAADMQLQAMGAEHYAQTGKFLISSHIQVFFEGYSEAFLIGFERALWWLHIVGILGFAVYVTYSKHLHIFLAFPNTYLSDVGNSGEMANMPELTKEVKFALGLEEPTGNETPPEIFGAKDVTDLTTKHLMDSFSCTECGRCTSSCPANITGKKLSPRAIMMKTRDRAEELVAYKQKNGKDATDGKSLLHDYITQEELNACTTCQACVEECPVNISPLNIITELRRHLILDEANAPAEWNLMFTNMENNFAPWQFSPEQRADWTNDLNN